MEPKMEERKAERDQLVARAVDNPESQTAERLSPKEERRQEDSYGSCGWFGEAPAYNRMINL
jgi:hypothetical protein